MTSEEVNRLLELAAEENTELERLVMKLIGEVLANAVLDMPVTFGAPVLH